MSGGKQRRVHTPVFNAKDGLQAVRTVKTVSEIAQIQARGGLAGGEQGKHNFQS